MAGCTIRVIGKGHVAQFGAYTPPVSRKETDVLGTYTPPASRQETDATRLRTRRPSACPSSGDETGEFRLI